MPTPYTSSQNSYVPETGTNYIDALLAGRKWGGSTGTAATVSYSFAGPGSVWEQTWYGGYEPDWSGYRALLPAEQERFEAALKVFSDVANITFQEVTETPTEVGDIRVAFSGYVGYEESAAWAYYPDIYPEAGDIWFDPDYEPNLELAPGEFGFSTMIHEIGHALGLQHPFSDGEGEPTLSGAFQTQMYSIMGYDLSPTATIEAYSLMLYDIAAIQHIYGANMSHNAGDTEYEYSNTQESLFTIWDGGGTDTLSAENQFKNAILNLTAGTFSSIGIKTNGQSASNNIAVAFNVTIENAIGGAGNDQINGNQVDNELSGGNGNDTIRGYQGHDRINGGAGVDILAGGEGDDIYEDVDITVSGTTAKFADTITELANQGHDIVQVRNVTWNMTQQATFTLNANIEEVDFSGAVNGKFNLIGNAENNKITGTNFDNLIDGGAGVDELIGGLGNDTYKVDQNDTLLEVADGGVDSVEMTATVAGLTFDMTGEYDNTDHFKLLGALTGNVFGNAEDNNLTGNTAANELTGGEGNDVLTGGAGNDTLDGGMGDDTLDGGAGEDKMDGGEGNDTYFVDSLNDTIEGEDGFTDLGDIVKSTVTFELAEGLEDLYLLGTAAINGTGNAGDNKLFGNDSANILDGGTGADELTGGKGNDVYIVDDFFTDVVLETVAGTAGGVDLIRSSVAYNLLSLLNIENLSLTDDGPDPDINAFGNDNNNVITGNSGHNELGGGKGNDTLVGNDGNDTLDGGAGVDSLAGGDGGDIYIVNVIAAGTTAKIEDTLTEAFNKGNDTVQLSSDTLTALKSAATLTLASNFENLDASGTDATLLNLIGNGLDNTLTGNNAANILDGGAGIDTLLGGLGNDTYKVDQNDVVTELNGEGTDTVEMTATEVDGFIEMGTYGFVENLKILGSLAVNVRGNDLNNVITGNGADNEVDADEGDDRLFGGLGDDVLRGEEGDDIIDGGAGADQMIGDQGNDTYYIDNVNDWISDEGKFGGELQDKAYASVSYALDDGVEYLYLVGAAVNGTGTNQDDNTITGNALNNTLSGRDGDDTLIGEAGNDVLDGGAGNDKMNGGAGNDTYVVDTLDDVITEALAGVAGGVDLVRSSISFDISTYANIENLTLTNDGPDTNIDGFGNDSNNIIIGNVGNNVLSGGKGNDTLEGVDGNDTLQGDSGIDTLKGGKDDDTYIIDLVLAGKAAKLEDTATEYSNEGIDTVELKITAPINLAAATTLTVGANIENLDASQTGTTKLNLTGNAFSNVLTGNDADNILDGGAGDDKLDGGTGTDILIGGLGIDQLAGGEGNDTYRVDESDTVSENDGEGVDTIEMTIGTVNQTLTMGLHIENAKLLGKLYGDVVGNDEHNHIIGNAASNILNGGDGNDILDGGAGGDILQGDDGDDTYVVDHLNDIVANENLAAGNDKVIASVLLAGAFSGVENYAYTGTAAWTFTGTSGDNEITGGTGNDILSGDAGNDTLVGNAGNDILNGGADADEMTGGAGNDTYHVDDAGDRVVELANGGTDNVIAQNVDIDLTQSGWEEIENVTYSGGWTPTALTGNARANFLDASLAASGLVIDGGAGADKISGSAFIDDVDGGEQDDIITGGAGDDSLDGGNGNDTMAGGLGKDTLTGGMGTDNLKGGEDDDLYVVNLVLAGTTARIEDTVLENTGEGDADKLQLGSTGTLSLTKATTLTLGAHFEDFDVSNTASTLLNLVGNALRNTIIGNNADNLIDGGAGNDKLLGHLGNDTLVGGLGNDELAGGDGDDIFRMDENDSVVELIGEGDDTIEMTATKAALTFDMATAFEFVENFKLLGALVGNVTGNAESNQITGNSAINALNGGDGNDILSGGGGNDTLQGGDEDDTLDGGAGDDKLVGGGGDDVYIVDSFKDDVDEASSTGVDMIKASILLAGLVNGIENYTYTGTAAWTFAGSGTDNVITGGSGIDKLTGDAGEDTLVGNAGDDVLNGGGDDDKLEGGIGNDTLNGGSGDDEMTGGAGNDIYYVDSGTDVIVELAGGGLDTIITATTEIDLETPELNEVEHVTYAAGGWAAMSTLTGNKQNNTLNASALSVAVVIDGGEGNDTLIGGGDGDELVGGKGNDILTGNGGDDDLTGGEGIDTLAGGNGGDLYIVSLIPSGTGAAAIAKLEDTIAEVAGINGGIDTIELIGAVTLTKATTLTIAANFENLDSTDTLGTLLNITGNALDNVITGNNANNILDGAAGNDQLFGGAGNDTLTGGLGNDLLDGEAGDDTFTGGAGIDTFAFDSFAEGADVIKDFNKALDILSFADIVDLNSNGMLDEIQVALENIFDKGNGNDVVLTFLDGGTITFEKLGTGSINELSDFITVSQILSH